MKSKTFRAICLSLVCLLLTCFLVTGCNNRNSSNNDSLIPGRYDPNAGISNQSAGDLVKDGTSSYKILLSASATNPEFTAANELSAYIKKLTRCNLPIEIESDYLLNNINDDSCYISIGRTKLLERQNFQIEYDKLNGNGFVIKTKGKNAFFVGANDQGTVYSVYDFLEKICGIKFLAYDYEYIPKDINDIVLPVLDIKEVPLIRHRSYMSEEVLSDASFNAKMRMVNEYDNVTAMAPYGGSVGFCQSYGATTDITHNSVYYVPVEIYGHDERYADMYHEVKRNGVYSDINIANGITDEGTVDESMEVSTIKVVLESLKQFALDNPNAVYFSIGPSDGAGYPTNESARIAAEKFTIEGVALRFYNCIAREIQKWADEELDGREINIVTMAYGYSYRAPVDPDGKGGYKLREGVTEMPDNLYIRLAPIESLHTLNIDDPKQVQMGKDLSMMQWYEEWASICNNFMIWQYSKRFWDFYWYFPTMQTWYKMYTHYINMGVDYMMTQSSNTCLNDWQAIMETYCSSKMMWNPNRDLNALKNEFIHYYFGEEAEVYVRQMIDNYDGRYRWMEEHAVTKEFGDYTEGSTQQLHYQSNYIISPNNWTFNFLDEQMNLLDTAMVKLNESENLTKGEKEIFIRNVERVKLTPLYMAYYNREKYNISEQTINNIYNEMFRIVDKLGETVSGELRFIDSFRR